MSTFSNTLKNARDFIKHYTTSTSNRFFLVSEKRNKTKESGRVRKFECNIETKLGECISRLFVGQDKCFATFQVKLPIIIKDENIDDISSYLYNHIKKLFNGAVEVELAERQIWITRSVLAKDGAITVGDFELLADNTLAYAELCGELVLDSFHVFVSAVPDNIIIDRVVEMKKNNEKVDKLGDLINVSCLGDARNCISKSSVDLNDTLEFNIDELDVDNTLDLSEFEKFDQMLTSDLLACADLPVPPTLPGMIVGDKKETNADNSDLERDETQGLPVYVITNTDKISEFDRMLKYRTSACFESFKMKVDRTDIEEGKRAFRFKDTDCILNIDDETPVFISNYGEEVSIVFTRPDKYIHTKSEPREYPCDCKAILDDVTVKLFKKYKKEEELVEAVKIFNRLTPNQQAYIRNQSLKPVVKEVTINKGDEAFTPIQDQDSLEMMYKICRNTYSTETRARLDTLISKLHSHHFGGETKADIVTQLSYALCIDTDAHQHRQKTYDEIMDIFNEYVYGMGDLKERIAEYILAMQYSGANYFCILLVGSPGVGKTSVCEAISKILDCELAHVDCSGVDTVGLCGLVKSYGGAQPSKISNVLIGKGKADLLLRLDELDKLVKDKNGDAYSALIKPFGPQRTFHDEYLDGDIDMSNTKIVCTANDISKIPGYILNRFGDNIFYIPDYDAKDKAEIAKHYIIARKLEEYKIKEDELIFTDEAIREIAANYCADSGAREITAYVESLIRKAIKGWSRGTDSKPLLIDVEYVKRNLRHNDNGKPRKQIGFTG